MSKLDIRVKKFGGTSVGSIERIESVADRLYRAHQNGERFVVVASAMAGETNRLIRLANELHSGFKGPAYDMLLASGEQVSIALLSLALQKRGLKSLPLLAYQLRISTDSIYSKARIKNIDAKRLVSMIEEDEIPIVAGFQGVDEHDRITTLGRGGSDTTAVALAAALESSVCEIYTDVDGVYSADPRIVPDARKIELLNYDEMMEMAALGSKVLHFRCVEIAAKYNVPIHVLSTFSENPGTMIQKEVAAMELESPVVSSVTHDSKVAILQAEPVPNGVEFLANLFHTLSEKEIIVDIIAQAQGLKGQRIAFSISDEDIQEGFEVLKSLVPESSSLLTLENMAKVSIIGVGMRSHSGVAARFFKVLAARDVDLKLVTTSDIKMSAVIPRALVNEIVQALHAEFHLGQ